MASALDVSAARSRFAALQQQQLYMDNAGAMSIQTGGSQVLDTVADSIGISTTQLLHNLSTARNFQPGDELVLSKLNHEANTAP
ncbi:hypothetical protein PDIDSM_4527 [Penicillium digitatum]|nr:hypothetical protein PDIDSM_4527 [Penicillium digitatum]